MHGYWRHPGGIVSLLEILGRVLKDTEECLIALRDIASKRDFMQRNRFVWVITLIVSIYMFSVPFKKPIGNFLMKVSHLGSFIFGKLDSTKIFKS